MDRAPENRGKDEKSGAAISVAAKSEKTFMIQYHQAKVTLQITWVFYKHNTSSMPLS